MKRLWMLLIVLLLCSCSPDSAPENKEYKINVIESEHGTILVEKDSAYEGEIINLTITPNEGCQFLYYYILDSNDVNAQLNGQTEYTKLSFIMPAYDITIYGIFLENAYDVTIEYHLEGLLLKTETTYAKEGTNVSVKEDFEGYVFDYLEISDQKYNENKFEMPSHEVTVKAYFKAMVFNILVDSNITNGSVLLYSTEVKYGEIINIEVVANPGYKPTKVTICDHHQEINDEDLPQLTENIVPRIDISYQVELSDITISAKFESVNGCDHEMEETVVKVATCIEEGEIHYYCSKCEETYIDYVSSIGHILVDRHCINCDYVYNIPDEIYPVISSGKEYNEPQDSLEGIDDTDLSGLKTAIELLGDNFKAESYIFFNELATNRVNTIYNMHFHSKITTLYTQNYIYRYTDDLYVNSAYINKDNNIYKVKLEGDTLEERLNSTLQLEALKLLEENKSITDKYFTLSKLNSNYVDTYGPTIVDYGKNYKVEYAGWTRISENKYKCDRVEVIEDFLSICAPGFSNAGTYMTYRYVTVEINPDDTNSLRLRVYASPTQIGKLIDDNIDETKANWYLLFAESYISNIDNVSVPALETLLNN